MVELYLHSPYVFMAWCIIDLSTGTTLPLLTQILEKLNVYMIHESIKINIKVSMFSCIKHSTRNLNVHELFSIGLCLKVVM
jgi:hypothetical protein